MSALLPFQLLATVLLACGAIVLAALLHRRHRDRFLHDYLIHLVLAAFWGFTLWTFPGLLPLLGATAFGHHELLKWFAFPFHLLQLYFLGLALAGMLGRSLPRRLNLALLGIALGLLALVFGTLLHRTLTGSLRAFGLVGEGITDLYLVFQVLLFLWAALEARRIQDPAWGRLVRLFCSVYAASFAVHVLLTTFVLGGDAACAAVFSAYHWPGLLVLAFGLRRRAEPLPGIDPGTLLDRPDLTERERDLLRRLLAGHSNQQMAMELFLSHQTVKNYVSRLYRKLGVANRIELMSATRGSQDPPVMP